MSTVLRAESAGHVRVVQVTREGSGAGWSALGNAIAKLSGKGFVALDTEFSGLDSSSALTDQDLSVRYEAIRSIVNSRALLSVGVSVFSERNKTDAVLGEADTREIAEYDVSTFDFIMCCETPWSIVSESGRFLVSHGFDFNRMFTKGIPYVRASTEDIRSKAERKAQGKMDSEKQTPVKSSGPFSWGPMPRGLLWRIGRAGVPIVVHNGLFDLALLYASFHGPLPATLNQFVSKVLDAVPAGVYDTKHLATTTESMRATFLGYLFAKSLQDRAVQVHSGAGLPRPEVSAPEDFAQPLKKLRTADLRSQSGVRDDGNPDDAGKKRPDGNGKTTVDPICMLFALRGHCPKGTACLFAHDIFDVLEYEQAGGQLPDVQQARKNFKKQQKLCRGLTCNPDENNPKRPRSGDVPPPNHDAQKKRKMNKKERKRMLGLQTPSANCVSELQSADLARASATESGTENVAKEDLERSVRGEMPYRQADHCAGWDAYMTGFCFATFRAKADGSKLSAERNRLPLAKKALPLLLCKSAFEELNAATLAVSECGDASKGTEKASEAKTESKDSSKPGVNGEAVGQ